MAAKKTTKKGAATRTESAKGAAAGKPTAQSLSKYQSMRDFKKSPEPSGKKSKSKKSKSLFFCVQKHLASHLHYDFRLEHHGVLLSWAVPKGPSLNPKDKRLAMRVEDHPFDYREFEGVIPEGYGAGIVMLWDRGEWVPEVDDIDTALEKGDLKLTLKGVKLKGSWALVRTKGSPWGKPQVDENGVSRSWLLIKHRDDWAGDVDVTEAAPDSVKSFGDFADILGGKKPEIWESHRPAEGGAAGKLFKSVIAEAVARKSGGAVKRNATAESPRAPRKTPRTKKQ